MFKVGKKEKRGTSRLLADSIHETYLQGNFLGFQVDHACAQHVPAVPHLPRLLFCKGSHLLQKEATLEASTCTWPQHSSVRDGVRRMWIVNLNTLIILCPLRNHVYRQSAKQGLFVGNKSRHLHCVRDRWGYYSHGEEIGLTCFTAFLIG